MNSVQMTDGEKATRLMLTDYTKKDREVFSALRGEGKARIKNISKDFPLELHRKVRDEILEWVGVNGIDLSFQLSFNVDSDIIVSDAFRVAKGKRSATPRIFCGPYVELVAHANIRNEVMEAIEKDLPNGADRQRALNHADYLLSFVKTMSGPMRSSMRTAADAIGNITPDDVPFLAVTLTSNSNEKISWDDSTYVDQKIVKRWDIRDYANIVSVTEGGTLSLYILSLAGMPVVKQVECLIALLYDMITEVFESLRRFLNNIATSASGTYEKLPLYLKRFLALGGVVSIIAVANKNDVRDPLVVTLRMVVDSLDNFLKDIKVKMKDLFQGIRELTVLLWDQIVPAGVAVVIIAGVLWDASLELIEDCQKLINGITDADSKKCAHAPGPSS